MSEQQEHIDTELISSAIAKAQRGLEQFAQSQDQALLGHCRADLQQVHGALKGSRQSAAQSLTGAILRLLDSLMTNLQDAPDDHTHRQQTKLILAVQQLPTYIGSGADSQLPALLKELQQLQKGPQRSWHMPGLITSGLMPDYLPPATGHASTEPIAQAQLDALQDDGFAVTVRKIRQKYQLCLAGVIRNNQRQKQLSIIGKLFAKLQNLCWDSPLVPLWEVCSALCEGLQEGAIVLDSEIIRLLSDIDHELRNLANTVQLNTPPPQKLFAQLMQRISQIHSDNALILALQQRYPQHKVKAPKASHTNQKPDRAPVNKTSTSKSPSEYTERFGPQSTYEIFAAQTNEIEQQLSTELPKWRRDFANHVTAGRIRRALHSLKGHGRIIGADVIGELAWSVENMLDSVIGGNVTASQPMAALLDEIITMLPELVRDFIDNSQQLTPEVLMCMEKADALAAGDHYDFDDEFEELDDFQDSPMMFGHTVADGDQEAVPQKQSSLPITAKAPTTQDQLPDLHWLSDATEHLSQWLDRIPTTQLQQCQHELRAVVDSAHNLEQPETAQLGDVLLDICVYLETYESSLPEQLLPPLNDGFTTLLTMINQGEQPANSPQGVFAALCGALESLLLGQPAALAKPTVTKQGAGPNADSKPEDEWQEPSAAITLPDYLGQGINKAPVSELTEQTATVAQQPSHPKAVQAHEIIQISTQRLETLINIAEESSTNRTCIVQQLAETVEAIEELNRTVVRLRDQFRRLDCEIQTCPQTGANPELLPLSNLLAESSSDLMELHSILQQKTRTAEILLQQQARSQIELHEQLLKTRMVPFNQLVPRLRTLVHRICTELDKPVELLVRGGEEELDKATLEEILPTLEHLLRNAIDHGIEDSADVRHKAGKPASGQISLTIHRDGMAVVVALADDGRGINIDEVQAKATAQQLVNPDEPMNMEQAIKLIMQPGFNTLASIAPLSAINREIRQLGGSVAVHSETGQGTHISLRLPFTQSIHRALLVSVGGSLYAMPMYTIDEVTMVASSRLSEIYQNQTPFTDVNGRQYELIYAGDLLGTGAVKISKGQRPVVLIRRDNDCIAVQVDAIEGSREIINKSLGAPFSSLTGVVGATIAGNGQVVIIIDPLALYRKYLTTETTPNQPDNSDLDVQVMVVDDSITARKTTSQLLARQGYQTICARDGAEALAQLAEQQPDIILVDVEMPHMDGFGLVSALRDKPALAHLPVIMMTCHSGEKQRSQAIGLGVSELVEKPFREKRLLSAIEALTEQASKQE